MNYSFLSFSPKNATTDNDIKLIESTLNLDVRSDKDYQQIRRRAEMVQDWVN